MKFYEVVTQVLALLQREGRVSYRALKIELDLTEDHLEALKEELVDAKRMAVDENGKVGVGRRSISFQLSVVSFPQPPARQTPNPELRTSQPLTLSPQPPIRSRSVFSEGHRDFP